MERPVLLEAAVRLDPVHRDTEAVRHGVLSTLEIELGRPLAAS